MHRMLLIRHQKVDRGILGLFCRRFYAGLEGE